MASVWSCVVARGTWTWSRDVFVDVLVCGFARVLARARAAQCNVCLLVCCVSFSAWYCSCPRAIPFIEFDAPQNCVPKHPDHATTFRVFREALMLTYDSGRRRRALARSKTCARQGLHVADAKTPVPQTLRRAGTLLNVVRQRAACGQGTLRAHFKIRAIGRKKSPTTLYGTASSFHPGQPCPPSS